MALCVRTSTGAARCHVLEAIGRHVAAVFARSSEEPYAPGWPSTKTASLFQPGNQNTHRHEGHEREHAHHAHHAREPDAVAQWRCTSAARAGAKLGAAVRRGDRGGPPPAPNTLAAKSEPQSRDAVGAVVLQRSRRRCRGVVHTGHRSRTARPRDMVTRSARDRKDGGSRPHGGGGGVGRHLCGRRVVLPSALAAGLLGCGCGVVSSTFQAAAPPSGLLGVLQAGSESEASLAAASSTGASPPSSEPGSKPVRSHTNRQPWR